MNFCYLWDISDFTALALRLRPRVMNFPTPKFYIFFKYLWPYTRSIVCPPRHEFLPSLRYFRHYSPCSTINSKSDELPNASILSIFQIFETLHTVNSLSSPRMNFCYLWDISDFTALAPRLMPRVMKFPTPKFYRFFKYFWDFTHGQ